MRVNGKDTFISGRTLNPGCQLLFSEIVKDKKEAEFNVKDLEKELKETRDQLYLMTGQLEASKKERDLMQGKLRQLTDDLSKSSSELTEATDLSNNFILSTQSSVIFLDENMIIRRFTPPVITMFNLVPEDVGKPISDFISDLSHKRVVEDAYEVLKSGKLREQEVEMKGKFYWMRILPYVTTGENIQGVVLTFINVTEHKRMEAEISQTKENYKLLFENMISGVVVQEILYDDKGEPFDAKYVEVNDAFTQHTGIPKESVLGRTVREVFPEPDMSAFVKFLMEIEKGKGFEAVEFVAQLNRYLRVFSFPFEGRKYVAVIHDITDQVVAQQELKRSEAKFRNLFENNMSGIAICQLKYAKKGDVRDSILIDMNPALTLILGIDTEKSRGKSTRTAFDMLDDKFMRNMYESIIGNKKFQEEVHWVERDRHLMFSAFSLHNDHFAIWVQDLTDEKLEFLARQHLAAIVESSDDAIYSISTEGEIISWNHGAELFYGYTADEILGKNISVLDDNPENVHIELIRKVRNGEKLKNVELIQKTKWGRSIPVSLTKSPVLNERDEVIAISDIVKDMTQIREREEELIRSREKAAEAGRLKTAFLQNVSHEIRTPMNSILGFTEILKNRLDENENVRFINAIDQGGKQLIHLIDDIMDVSRIESGELVLEKTNFKLEKLLRQIRNQFEGVLKSGHKEDLKLNLVLPQKEKSTIIYSDKFRLQQILINLLSNAFKYTDSGSIEFGYRDQGDNEILFFVSDTGIGIREENLRKIFERFSRVHENSQKVVRGTGLGLAIANGLTGLLGGRIWCESKENEGSTFFFTIHYDDFVEEDGIPDEVQSEKLEIPDLNGKKILITEDDNFSFEMIKLLLSPTNVTILHASDGFEAMEMFENNYFDLIMLDIQMPFMDGYQVLKKIREKNKRVPVIALTAYAMPEDKRKSMKAGFNEHLTKPINSRKLFNMFKCFI